MGGIKKTKKTYDMPRKRWDRTRIEEEKVIKKTYGLKNKRELRIFQTYIRKKRQNAKNLLAMPLDLRLQREKELIKSLARYGVLPENATLDDVLSLQTEEILEKRLQTIVWRQNLAKTPIQARQFIVHGHIAVAGAKITAPNHLLPIEEVDKLGYFGGKKMQLEPPKPESKAELKKEFEKAAKKEETKKSTEEKPQEPIQETDKTEKSEEKEITAQKEKESKENEPIKTPVEEKEVKENAK